MSKDIISKNYFVNPWLLYALRDLKNEAKVEVDCMYVNRYDTNYIVDKIPVDLDRWQLAITVTGEYEKALYFDYLLKQLLTKCENLNKCLGVEKEAEVVPIDKDSLGYYAQAITDEIKLHKRLFYDDEDWAD